MSNSRIRYTRAQVQARAVEIDLNVVISDVIFPSMPEGRRFRFTAVNEGNDKISFKLERLKSAQIWHASIEDISNHGPAGVPIAAVLNVLKESITARKAVIPAAEEEAAAPAVAVVAGPTTFTSPEVDAFLEDDGSVTIELLLPIGGLPLEYTFHLAALERQPIDILESALNDARDEIRVLQDELQAQRARLPAPTIDTMVLRTGITTNAGRPVVWDTVSLHQESSPTFQKIATKENS